MFVYLVINKSSVPIFQYPDIDRIGERKIDSVLFAALMSAINSFSLEIMGDILGEMSFGAVTSTMSKDEYGNLHVMLTTEDVDIEANKQLHIEIKSLFLSSLNEYNMKNEFNQLTDGNLLNKLFIPIFDPLRRVWEKKLQKKRR